MNTLRNSIIAMGILLGFNGLSQDTHFSQVAYSPLTLNPALAGANSVLQGVMNYRNQWNSVTSPYKTFAASIDARLNENKSRRNGILAAGLNFGNDRAGDLKLTTNQVNLTMAYHLILSRKSTLGVGMYAGFEQRSIDPSAGRWESQYDGTDYNSGLSSGEVFNNVSSSIFDAGGGLLYTYKNNSGYMTQNNRKEINAGLALFNVPGPGSSFQIAGESPQNMRMTAFVNARIGLQNSRGSVSPGIYYQRQGALSEFVYGTYYNYAVLEGSQVTGFNKPMVVSFGLFNRFKDAIITKFMLEYDLYSVGLAYDINLSSLQELTRTQSGFELFVRFNLPKGNDFRSKL
jgi:type IX secretion system PorP/SprF family membrane protein